MEEQHDIVEKETEALVETFVRLNFIPNDTLIVESVAKFIRLSLTFMFLAGRKHELILGNAVLKKLANDASEIINGV